MFWTFLTIIMSVGLIGRFGLARAGRSWAKDASLTNRFIATTGPERSAQYQDNDIIKVSESVVFKGYRNIIRRDYLLPTGKSASYDILTQKHLSVVVFVWNTTSSTTTLIREYHPGAETFMYGAVAGMYEGSKHESPLQASQLELEEEAHLRTENWIPLLDTGDTSMSFDKYSTNRFYAYLALDCEHVPNPRSVDDEELITIQKDVSYTDMMKLVTSGRMNVVSTYAILLGVRKLQELGIKLE